MTRAEVKKTIIKAVIFTITALVVVTVYAVINDFAHKIHVINPESVSVDLNESYVED